MNIKFKETSRRKVTLADISFKERELLSENGLEPNNMEVIELEVQMNKKEIPLSVLTTITQESIYQQKFEKVKEYIDEIKRRGYDVIIDDNKR
jgi:hypothetical protein